MFFIARWNLKIVISILIFTFYIINQISIIIKHITHNSTSFSIFTIKSYLTEVLKKPGGGTPALNVMAIRDQGHANVSKQRMLLADVDVTTFKGRGLDRMPGKCFASRNKLQQC